MKVVHLTDTFPARQELWGGYLVYESHTSYAAFRAVLSAWSRTALGTFPQCAPMASTVRPHQVTFNPWLL